MTLGTRYNKRVCECKIAIQILTKKLDLKSKNFEKIYLDNFKDLKELKEFLKKSFDEMISLIN